MTLTSQVPAVIDYLVTQSQASPALGQASPKVSVFDGPQAPVNWQQREQVLWIGADPASLGDPAADAAQDFATALDKGNLRDELGDIVCAARHWSGDTANKVHRDGAAGIVAGVEILLRGNGTAGEPGDASMGGLVLWSQVAGPYQWYPRQVANGAECLVVFRVTYRARLTT